MTETSIEKGKEIEIGGRFCPFTAQGFAFPKNRPEAIQIPGSVVEIVVTFQFSPCIRYACELFSEQKRKCEVKLALAKIIGGESVAK